MSCEIQKPLTLRSPSSCTSNNIDHVAESSRECLCLKKPFFISLFSAKINSHQPPRKMAFVVGLLLLEAWLGLVICLVAMMVAYFFRIAAEERLLVSIFGDQYTEYQTRTWRLLPFVW